MIVAGRRRSTCCSGGRWSPGPSASGTSSPRPRETPRCARARHAAPLAVPRAGRPPARPSAELLGPRHAAARPDEHPLAGRAARQRAGDVVLRRRGRRPGRLRRLAGAALHARHDRAWASSRTLRARRGDVRPRRRAARPRDRGLGAGRRVDRHEPARRPARAADRAGPRELPGELPVPVRDARLHHARHQPQLRRRSC